MTQDPRILPDEKLAEWEADAEAHLSDDRNVDLLPRTLDPHRDIALIEHGKALAGQVDTLTRERDEYRRSEDYAMREANRQLARTDAAEADKAEWVRKYVAADTTATEECARADAAVLRLAELKEAIHDLADELERDGEPSGYVNAIRALLTEDGPQ